MTTLKMSNDHKPWLSVSSPWVLATLLALPSTQLQAQMFGDDEEDPYAETPLVTQRINQFSSMVELNGRYLSDDAFKFGEYDSQDAQGWQLDGAFDLELREFDDGTANYLRAEGDLIGSDSGSASIEAGKQGDVKLKLYFKGTEKQVHGAFKTPYDLSDPNNQTLTVTDSSDPAPSWNADMAEYSMTMDREKMGIEVSKYLDRHWNFTVKVDSETKQGARDTGIYSGRRPTIVWYPIDYRTDTVNLGAEYAAENYQVQVGYEFSSFDNAEEILIIEDSSDNGSLAGYGQEPDNTFQQLSVALNYRMTPMTTAKAFFAYGLGEQDEALLPASINAPGLVTLPRNSAEAEVTTLIARLGVTSRVTNKLSLDAKFNYQDRENDTEAYVGQYARMDATSGPRDVAIADYDTKKQSLELSGTYRLPKASKVRAGYKYEEVKRPGQDRDETEEDKLWLSYKLPMMERFSGTFKLSLADRTGSTYTTDAISAQTLSTRTGDPLTRDYPLADRKQTKGQFNGQYLFGNSAYLGLMLQRWQDDYDKPSYGLQDLDGTLYSVNMGASPMRTLSYSVYAGVQRFEYDQKSVSGGNDWTLLTDDETLLAGIEIDWEAIANVLKVNAGYRYSRSRGELSQTNEAGPVTPLPDLKTSIHTLELGAEYFLDLQTTLLARAVYEDYAADNWSFDGIGAVASDGTRDYLTGGMVTPNHHAGLIEFGIRYQF